MNDLTHQQTPTPQPRGRDGPEAADPSRRLWGLWRDGQQPRVEDFLERAGIHDPEQIVMVLRVDQAERCRRGQWVSAEDYLDAFPTIRDHAESAIDLVFAEFLLQEERGERPALEEFLRRFPQYAGELKLQIELHRAIDADRDPTALRAGSSATLAVGSDSAPADRPAAYPEILGYEILGVLGRGGMGIVYRSWQAELKRLVAVKMLIAGALASPEVVARVRVEVEAMARLRHPNIVQIHGVGQHAGAPFLVLELVEGRSLAQILAGTPQPAEWAARTVETLARAIHAAHLVGVVHRDLSPANILMAADGTPKITDFGLAKLIVGGGSLRTQTGDLLGTPSYMAPEQAESSHRAVGAATDIYALGAILYEMLTGRPPFKAEQPLETLRQVVSDEPVTPSRLRPRLPADLGTICLKCLHKEPARRYVTAEALADELRRFLQGRPIEARRSTRAERAWRWSRRNPGLAAASIGAAMLATVLVIGSTVAAWKFRRDNLRIQSADRKMSESLFDSLVAQAQARRFSRRLGQRFESLRALEQAVAIAQELKLPPDRSDLLRDEVIACLALPDLKQTGLVIRRPPEVLRAAFDSTMSRYALRFRDGTTQVRRVADDAEMARFPGRGDRDINVFGFSPDGRYLATTHFPGFALTIWDIDKDRVAVSDPGPVWAWWAAQFSPDSRRIALTHKEGDLLVYDLATGRQVGRWRIPNSGHIAIRADGAQIAVLQNEPGNSTCRIVEAESGRVVRSITLPAIGVHVAWSPDGTTLATACQDFRIYLWDAIAGTRRATLEGHTNLGLTVAFHPAGTLLASSGWEPRLRLWDAVLGRPVLSWSGDNYYFPSEFSRDGRIVISVEDQFITYEVDPALEYRTFARAFEEPAVYQRPSIRPDGRVLALGTNRGVVLWDLARGAELSFLPIGYTHYALFDASGDLLTLSGGSLGVQRWPVQLDRNQGQFRIGPPRRLPLPVGGFGGLAADRSGRIVAAAEFDVTHVLAPDRAFPVGPLDDCRYVAVSPDGQWLATGSHGKNGAQVWQIRDGERVADLKVEGLVGVAFSPDGKWLMTSPFPCRLWAVGTWNEALRISGEGYVFTPDSRHLLVQGANRVLRLVETETGRTVARLETPDLCALAQGGATFSPDGSRLVVVTNDGPAVHVWDLRAIRKHLARMGLDWDAPSYSEVDPASPDPLPALVVRPIGADPAVILRRQRSQQELIQAAERMWRLLAPRPHDAEDHHRRGRWFYDRRHWKAARYAFDQAILLRPDDPYLYRDRADCALIEDDDVSSVSDLRKMLELQPANPGLLRMLAWLYVTGKAEVRRSPEEALPLALKALRLNPRDPLVRFTVGAVQYRLGRYDEADRIFEADAKENHLYRPYNDFFLAMARHRLGRRVAARDAYERALKRPRPSSLDHPDAERKFQRLRAETEAVLASPADDLPADVFAPRPMDRP